MKKRQFATIAIALGLTVAVSAGATLAILSAKSETVTNTFVVGEGLHDTDITLNEAPVNPATGKEIAGERVQTNTYQNLEQGSELDKDPSVTIKNSAADCYVFVEVSNLKNNTAIYDVTIDNNWMKVDSKSTATTDVYVYTTNGTDPAIVSGGLTTANGIVFDGVSIKDDAVLFDEVVENGVVTGYTAKTLSPIVLKACAVQANNTTYAEALNEVAFGA